MNRNQLLLGLLLASWTLNVALGVALFLKTQYPSGGFWGDSEGRAMMTRPGESGPPFRMNPRFLMDPDHRRDITPMMEHRRELLIGIADLVTADDLDTVKISVLSDSLERLNLLMQKTQINHMIEMHGKIPPHARRELVPRMMRKFGMNEGMPDHRSGRNRDHGKQRRERHENESLNQ